MRHPLVKNIRKESYDVYIGRPSGRYDPTFMHWGNPFSHRNGNQVQVITSTIEDAVLCFEQWLNGHWGIIEPERRQWIVDHIHELKGKTLGCFGCTPVCHGDVLARLANGE